MQNRQDMLKALELAMEDKNYAAANQIANDLKAYDVKNAVIAPDAMTKSAKLEELDRAASAKNMTGSEWAAYTAQQGLTATPSALYGAGQLVADIFRDENAMPGNALQRFGGYFGESQDYLKEDVIRPAVEATGGYVNPYTPEQIAAQDPLGGYGTPVVEALSDPSSWFGVGSARQLAQRGAQVTGAAITSKTASDIGAEADKALGGDGQIGATVGALGGALAGPAVGGATLEVAAKTGAGTSKFVLSKLNVGDINKTIESKAAYNLLNKIAAEEGVSNIESVIKDFGEISSVVGEANFPLLVTLSGNKMLQSELRSLVSRKPEVRQQLESELARLSDAINNKADNLFGSQAVTLLKTKVNPEVERAANNARTAVQTIDGKIAELTDPLISASNKNVGEAVQNLVKAKEATVRTELSPKYEALKYEADAAGVVMPGKAAQQIWDFVQQNNMMDIFGRKTQAEKLINSHFRPKSVEGNETLVMKNGELSWEQGAKESPDVAFSNVESLKAEVNRLLRTTTEGRDRNRLLELKQVVEQAREQIPGDWSQRLADLDLQYYQRVGIPFGEKGVVDINAKKYAEQVAPVIVDKPSAMVDFLNVAGDQGAEIGTNAVLARMYKEAVDPQTGKISDVRLNTFLKKHRDVIDTVPGLRTKVDEIKVNTDRLFIERAAINEKAAVAEKNLSDASLLALDPNAISFSDMSQNVLAGTNMQKFLSQANTLEAGAKEAVINRMRREVIDNARRSGDPVAYLSKPDQITNMNKLFGDQYVKDMKSLARLSKALDDADMAKVNYTPAARDTDPVKAATGVEGTYVLAQLRDRIASNVQKGARIFSKIFQGKKLEALDNQLTALIFDPEGLEKLAAVARDNTVDGKIKITNTVVNDFNTALKFAAPSAFAVGVKELAREGEDTIETYEPQPFNPAKYDVTQPSQPAGMFQ